MSNHESVATHTLRTLQLYATGSATGNAIAQVTIPSASTIKGVLVGLRCQSITAAGDLALELSKVPTSLIATNGALDPFLHICFYSNFVTSGMDQGAQNLFVPVHVPCRQGEIVYVHAFISGTVTYKANFILVY